MKLVHGCPGHTARGRSSNESRVGSESPPKNLQAIFLTGPDAG
jgi:hypothetical protein